MTKSLKQVLVVHLQRCCLIRLPGQNVEVILDTTDIDGLDFDIRVTSITYCDMAGPTSGEDCKEDKWETPDALPQWLVLDLGSESNITALLLDWGLEYANSYDIQVNEVYKTGGNAV